MQALTKFIADLIADNDEHGGATYAINVGCHFEKYHAERPVYFAELRNKGYLGTARGTPVFDRAGDVCLYAEGPTVADALAALDIIAGRPA